MFIHLTNHPPYGGKNIELKTDLPRPFVLKHNNKFYMCDKTVERLDTFDGRVDYTTQQHGKIYTLGPA